MKLVDRWGALALAGIALMATSAHAQIEANLSSLEGDNAKGYLSPLATGLSSGLNSGIFRSGNVPVSGFNFGLEVKALLANFSDESRVYTTAETPGFASTEAPTLIGDTGGVTQSGTGGATVGYPGGFDMDRFAFAAPQLTFGSYMGTRAIVRFISVELGDSDLGDLSLFGIGAQHSISQYFKDLPVDVAAGLMYQKFKLGTDTVKADALAFNVTGSKAFGGAVSFEPYLGLGYDSLKMEAEYENSSLSETLNVDFDRQNDFHLSVGAGLNFPVIRLHAEFTKAAETGFAGGVSFGY